MNESQHGSAIPSDDNNNNDEDAEGCIVVSVDPGSVNCAVVRYDAGQDRITHASLLNLLCTCLPGQRGRGALPRLTMAPIPAVDPTGGAVAKPNTARLGKRKRKRKKPTQPSTHQFPDQLMERVRQHQRGLFRDDFGVLALERQKAMATGNMVIESCLKTRYLSRTLLVDPNAVKAFWNRAAESVEWPQVAFRGGSHAINKTDARGLGRCALTATERALLRMAAEKHYAHRMVCPVMRRKDGKNKNRKVGVPKLDDLFDAALQAIYAAQAVAPDTGAAAQRLRRGRVHYKPRRRHQKSKSVPGKTTIKTEPPRKRAKKPATACRSKNPIPLAASST